ELSRHVPPALITETISLALLDAVRVAASLKTMLGDTATGAPYIEADSTRNSVIVHGSQEQVRHVKNMIQALGENPALARGLTIYQLEKGNASSVADAIRRVLRDIDVRVIVPGVDNPLSEPERRPESIRPKR